LLGRLMPAPTLPVASLGAPPVGLGAGITHVGLVRQRNEDSILTDPTGALWAVADGMGGHGSGDVASDIVVERLSTAPDGADPLDVLETLLIEANEIIYRLACERGRTMGATVVALMIENAVGYLAWAGDSRAYLLRNGRLRLLTRDHTVIQDLVDDGLIRPEEARGHAEANVVTRAIGAEPEIEIDSATVPFLAGDRMILCSDGLTGSVGDGTIAALLDAAETPEDACRSLLRAALEDGAPDNVSVVAIFMDAG
jgi:PPM family protein phosphatase